MIVDVETELVTILAMDDVATRLPRDLDARLPFTRLARLPGSTHVDPDTGHLEQARIGLDTYDVDDLGAFAAITVVLNELAALAGTAAGAAYVTAVRVQTPWASNDPDRPDLARYQAAAVVFVHALPTPGS